MSHKDSIHSLYWLDDEPSSAFPPLELALRDPDGLLCFGGDLTPTRLLNAYRQGIFPWFSDNQPIMWWSPDPRTVLFPTELKISRSLRRTLRQQPYRITLDTAFTEVISACAAPRPNSDGTWITPEMQEAYITLYELGHAHSVEAWQGEQLVGGLYGIAIGRVFFGESMFSRARDASKIAFVHLVDMLMAQGVELIDCQVYSEHLASLGAREIPRKSFAELLDEYCPQRPLHADWSARRLGLAGSE